MEPRIDAGILALSLGQSWATKLCAMLGYERRHAYRIAQGECVPRRRPLTLLQHYARQKIGATASRRQRGRDALERQLATENAALDALLAWCESELAKKK
jgi:hypothetical protein